ncbi:hypothetical protein Hdeb2414_s0016g00492461 [Helianthus debilis subsp. tardiflorus]
MASSVLLPLSTITISINTTTIKLMIILITVAVVRTKSIIKRILNLIPQF